MIQSNTFAQLQRATLIVAMALLLQTSTLAADECSSEHLQKFYDLLPVLVWPLAAIAIVTLILLTYALKVRTKPEIIPEPPSDTRLNQEDITHTFISAIPTLTRELNLEVATTEQVETFDSSHTEKVLWGLVNARDLPVPHQAPCPRCDSSICCLLSTWR
jgi:hypothetical protein